jgi:uncharacterized protein (TIGR03435 family)
LKPLPLVTALSAKCASRWLGQNKAVFVVTCAVFAQESSSPVFEVASIKPSTDKDRIIGLFTYPGGRVTATNYTLKMLINEAYAIEDYRILGGPAWADSDRYNLEAKPPASSPSSKWAPASIKTPPSEEMRRMLQTLLADRFHLKTHRESKKERIYVLVNTKGGAKLKAPAPTTTQPFVSFRPNGLSGTNATLDQLTERLADVLGRPVSNRTDIAGHFDFLIAYPPDDAGTDRTTLLLSAIQDQVGLKLETEPGSIDVIVIDQATKPSAN